MQKTVLEARGIVKTFPGVQALKGVHFDVREGEIHALCGENGAGKSTLMHILAGVQKQDSGSIYLDGEAVHINNKWHANELGISIVYQERSLVEGLNVAENIYAAKQPVSHLSIINWKALYSKTWALLEQLDIHIDPKTMVGELSPAIQQMIEIAKALATEPKVLILDEPTATITEREVGALFALLRKLKEKKIAIIYISHRLSEIFDIADRVTVFKDGEHVNTENVKNVDKEWLVNSMVGRSLTFDRVENEEALGDTILEVKSFQSKKFRDINFKLRKGEIISFAGLAGAGRTEVMRAIFGVDKKTSGEIWLEGKKIRIRSCKDAIRHGIGYMPEDRKADGLFLDMAVSKNIASACLEKVCNGPNVSRKKMEMTALYFKDKLSIVTPSVNQKVVNLSGGNQQKVVFAKWLLVNPKILIVDEPTLGVDVGAKAEIYSILRELAKNGTSIIVVSSDLMEVLSISDRVYVMYNGTITGELKGSEATEELIMKYASGIMYE